jgi:hypothetical protein
MARKKTRSKHDKFSDGIDQMVDEAFSDGGCIAMILVTFHSDQDVDGSMRRLTSAVAACKDVKKWWAAVQ